MPHLANLMIPDKNGNHPLSANPFSVAVVAYVAGDWNPSQYLTYMNNVLADNVSRPLISQEQAELQQLKTNFDAARTLEKMFYSMKLAHYSMGLEDAELSEMTAADFDTWMDL